MSSWFGKSSLAVENRARAAQFANLRKEWLETCYKEMIAEIERRFSRAASKGKLELTIDLQDFKYPEVYSPEFKDLLILTKNDLTRDDIKAIKDRVEEWATSQEMRYSSTVYWKIDLDCTPQVEVEDKVEDEVDIEVEA